MERKGADEKGVVIGVDYGTTTTQVSYLATHSLPDLYPIGRGEGYSKYSVRSVIAIHPETREIRVGDDASLMRAPWVVLPSLKRCVRCSFDKATGVGECTNPPNQALCLGRGQYMVGSKVWTVSDLIDTFLQRIATRVPDKTLNALNYSVPPGYTNADVRIISGAVRMAFKPKVLATPHHEPTCALMVIRNDSGLEDGVHIVVDVGGGTSDLVTVERRGDDFFIHEPTSMFLAGDDFDSEVFRYFRRRIATSDVSDYELRTACRVAKEQLTTSAESTVLGEAFTREELEDIIWELAAGLVEFIAEYSRARIREFNTIERVQVLRVHLVGGGSRIPLLTRLLLEARVDGVARIEVGSVSGSGISQVYGPDLGIFCVALGNLLEPSDVNLSLLPVTLRIFVGGKTVRVIDSHTPFPVHFHVSYESGLQIIAEAEGEKYDLLRDARPTLPPLRSFRSSGVTLRAVSAREQVADSRWCTFHITSGGFMFLCTANRERWYEAPWKNLVDERRRQAELERRRREYGLTS